MTLQPITHRGRTAAAATRTRFFLAETLDKRPTSDPERTFVIFMCAYAGDVLSGVLPGPYTDEDAGRYARACLVPAELLERAQLRRARRPSAQGARRRAPHGARRTRGGGALTCPGV